MTLHARRTGYTSRKRQRGVALIMQAAIVAAIAIVFAASTLWHDRQAALSAKVAAQGVALNRIGNAYNTYIVTYYTNLVNNTAISGVANVYAPTPAELKTLGVLSTSVQPTPLFGGAYQATLSLSPTGCTPPACDVVGLVYSNKAITDPGTGKALPLGDAVTVSGGPAADGGFSTAVSSNTISGYGASWSTANPVGAVSGILGMKVGYGSSGFSAFLRRDGTLPMTGDLNLTDPVGGAHNITGANVVNANQLVTPAGAGVKVGNSTFYGDASGNTDLRQSGGVYIQNQAGTSAADIKQVGNVTSNGLVNGNNLLASGTATAGSACTTAGMQAQNSDGSGSPLFCQSGVWSATGGALDGSYTGEADGGGTGGRASCPIGSRFAFIDLARMNGAGAQFGCQVLNQGVAVTASNFTSVSGVGVAALASGNSNQCIAACFK